MSANTRNPEDSTEVDVGHAQVFDADQIAEMPVGPEPPGDSHLTLVAVAAKSSVQKIDGSCRDAARVLYMSLDGNHAVERIVTRATPNQPGKIPAAVHVAEGYSRVGTPSECVVSIHAEALEAHREQWLDEVDR